MAMPPTEYGHNIQGWKKIMTFSQKILKIRFLFNQIFVQTGNTST